jgi:hypothetical protein
VQKRKNKNVEAREGWLDLDNSRSAHAPAAVVGGGEDLLMHAEIVLDILSLLQSLSLPSHGYAHRIIAILSP